MWNPTIARKYLDDAAHQRASGPGLSDTTLGRLAALQDPASSESRAGFVRALQRAGWRPRRITKAVVTVQSASAPKPSLWARLWARRRTQRLAFMIGVSALTIIALIVSSGLSSVLLFAFVALAFLAICEPILKAHRREVRDRFSHKEKFRIEQPKPPRRVAPVDEDDEEPEPVTRRVRRR